MSFKCTSKKFFGLSIIFISAITIFIPSTSSDNFVKLLFFTGALLYLYIDAAENGDLLESVSIALAANQILFPDSISQIDSLMFSLIGQFKFNLNSTKIDFNCSFLKEDLRQTAQRLQFSQPFYLAQFHFQRKP